MVSIRNPSEYLDPRQTPQEYEWNEGHVPIQGGQCLTQSDHSLVPHRSQRMVEQLVGPI